MNIFVCLNFFWNTLLLWWDYRPSSEYIILRHIEYGYSNSHFLVITSFLCLLTIYKSPWTRNMRVNGVLYFVFIILTVEGTGKILFKFSNWVEPNYKLCNFCLFPVDEKLFILHSLLGCYYQIWSWIFLWVCSSLFFFII